MREIPVDPLQLENLEPVLGPERFAGFTRAMTEGDRRLGERTFWHINSTADGGGVAEILQSVLGYLSPLGINARWIVIDGDDDFFALTKHVHNMLHGKPSEGPDLDDAARAVYEKTLEKNLSEGILEVSPGDIAILHDPQTLGLARALREKGCTVLWSCHVGIDEANDTARAAWRFLMPYAREAQAHVFSRRAYAWEGLDDRTIHVIPPCIDGCSVKNRSINEATVRSILDAAGIIAGHNGAEPHFQRPDGTEGTVERKAEILEARALETGTPFALQVSRWDALKDPIGVLRGFIDNVPKETGAHIVLAGPAPSAVQDDPEGVEVLDEVRAAWESLPQDQKERAHIVCLPMDDGDENAAIVNAIQRRADVVIQKSLAEGFGLTVAEAMWKARPVVGSKVGGIQDQIVDGESGLLVRPDDLKAFGAAVTRLLQDEKSAKQMGEKAHERASEEYLADRYLVRWMELAQRVAG